MKLHEITISKTLDVKDKNPKPLGLSTYFDMIRNETEEQFVGHYRQVLEREGKEKARFYKNQIPCVTPSAFMINGMADSNVKEYTGIICIDVDHELTPETIAKLKIDPHTLALHKTVSGNGYAIYYIVPQDVKKHKNYFEAIAEYLLEEYEIFADPACKNIARKRFVSIDKNIYINENAKKWIKSKIKKPKYDKTQYIFNDNDIDHILQQIQDTGKDLTNNSYHIYLDLGFAICSKYGESGRAKYHIICQNSTKYNPKKCDTQYTNCLKSKGEGITISTFYYHAKLAGLEYYRPQTKAIIKHAKISKKQGSPSVEKTKEYVYETTGLELDEKDIKTVKDALSNTQIDSIDEDPNANNATKLREFIIDMYQPKYNEINGKIILDGFDTFDNRALSTVTQTCKEHFSFKVSQKDVMTILNSEQVKTINPIKDFFREKYDKEKDYNGEIRRFFRNIDWKHDTFESFEKTEQIYTTFITKWMVGAIHNIFNDSDYVNESVLVFRGGQGIGKTSICRKLIPKQIFEYYSEQAIDRATNDTLKQLSTNFIINFDELGGMIKKDPEGFKKLSSTTVMKMRMAYKELEESYTRIASFLGTTNESEILRDPTGNRRIFVLDVIGTDWEQFKDSDSTPAWMEAYQLFKNNYDWNTNTPELRKYLDIINEAYQETTSEEDLFYKYLTMGGAIDPECEYSHTELMNKTEILTYLQERTPIRLTYRDMNNALKRISEQAKHEFKQRKYNGKSRKAYLIGLKLA